ncbi:unnamed protein product [Miscanthus lutarioriparius]|uniref:Uncharacterized protein n=1 Tax=Miscanthus lutarioriparius TaxID=422564 RepID=A0A811SQ98_9POAL|nr:unnamed protein product [Miscanthus lutarioriparius]
MVATVRRPSRAQLGALVDGERQTHSHLAATVASEAKRGLETLMMGRPTNPLHTSPAEEDFLLQIEGPLCSNVGSESRRPHAQLSGAALVDGGCQTHHRAVTATSQETRGPETLMTGFSTSALRSSSAVAGIGKTMVQQTLIHRSHGMSDPAETHRRTAIATSEDADGLETLIPS